MTSSSPPLEAWESALNEAFSPEQQGRIFYNLAQGSKAGHDVVREVWNNLHCPDAEKLKGAVEGRMARVEAGMNKC